MFCYLYLYNLKHVSLSLFISIWLLGTEGGWGDGRVNCGERQDIFYWETIYIIVKLFN